MSALVWIFLTALAAAAAAGTWLNAHTHDDERHDR